MTVLEVYKHSFSDRDLVPRFRVTKYIYTHNIYNTINTKNDKLELKELELVAEKTMYIMFNRHAVMRSTFYYMLYLLLLT